jgi:hypothetical protein
LPSPAAGGMAGVPGGLPLQDPAYSINFRSSHQNIISYFSFSIILNISMIFMLDRED